MIPSAPTTLMLYTLHTAFFPFFAKLFASQFAHMLYPGLLSLFPFHTSPSILVSFQISTQITLLSKSFPRVPAEFYQVPVGHTHNALYAWVLVGQVSISARGL